MITIVLNVCECIELPKKVEVIPSQPSQELLDKWGMELTGEFRIPVKTDGGYASYANDLWLPKDDGFVDNLSHSTYGGKRWILRKKVPKLIEEKDIPLCAIIRKKNLSPDQIEKACLALVRYANTPDHVAWSKTASTYKRILDENCDLMNFLNWQASEEGSSFWASVYSNTKEKCVEPELPPKPSQELLDTWGMELTGECRIPVKTDDGYVASAAKAFWAREEYANRHSLILNESYDKKRWILRKKVPKVEPCVFDLNCPSFQDITQALAMLEKVVNYLGGDITGSYQYGYKADIWSGKVTISKKNI